MGTYIATVGVNMNEKCFWLPSLWILDSIYIDGVSLLRLTESSNVLKFLKLLTVSFFMKTGTDWAKGDAVAPTLLQRRQMKNRESIKEKSSKVSTIFNLLRFHFYPSAIATVATKCGEYDKREGRSYSVQ
jgi:hypothetical protein